LFYDEKTPREPLTKHLAQSVGLGVPEFKSRLSELRPVTRAFVETAAERDRQACRPVFRHGGGALQGCVGKLLPKMSGSLASRMLVEVRLVETLMASAPDPINNIRAHHIL
jgi:hypothetical protein